MSKKIYSFFLKKQKSRIYNFYLQTKFQNSEINNFCNAEKKTKQQSSNSFKKIHNIIIVKNKNKLFSTKKKKH